MESPRIREVLLIVCLLSGCGHPLPRLDGIDVERWRNDAHGCAGVRKVTIDTINHQKQKLQGLNEMELVELLGRPDQTELFDRNQKFYFYDLEGNSTCGTPAGRRLSVRFNAVGLAKEVTII